MESSITDFAEMEYNIQKFVVVQGRGTFFLSQVMYVFILKIRHVSDVLQAASQNQWRLVVFKVREEGLCACLPLACLHC